MSELNARRLEMLGEFAELVLATARDLHRRGLAAEDNTEAARLADSLHRTGRGLRQTLALHAKLERDDKRGLIEDACEARSEAQRTVARRRIRLEARVSGLIWQEHEADESEALVEQLGNLLDLEQVEDDFLTEPMDHMVARLAAELGLPSPLAGEEPAPDLIRGVVRSATDEGSHGDLPIEPPDSPAQPLIRPNGHLLPQGEKDERSG